MKARAKKPQCDAKKISSEAMTGLPYTLVIDYSTKGQRGKVSEVRIPSHFIEKAIEPAIRKAWALGFVARMEQEEERAARAGR